jgi:hypothetical protein
MQTTTTLVFTALAACGGIPYKQPSTTLDDAITQRGAPIYVGTVYPRKGNDPTYVYERRVEAAGPDFVSTHVTRDLAGTIQLAETALHTPAYDLRSYTLHANQLGQRGSIAVDGTRVTFRVEQDGKTRTKTEQQSAPVVVGPTLVGYMFRHLDELRHGATLPVRMAILDRLETIGFELERVTAADNQTRIRMRASSWIVRLAVDPIYFTFDTPTGKLARIEGIVPTKIRTRGWRGERWSDFDARVEYQFVADAYR